MHSTSVRPWSAASRYARGMLPGTGAAVSGISGPVMTRSQNSLVDSSSRSKNSSSPKRIFRGTIWIPRSSAVSLVRSQALSVTTCMPAIEPPSLFRSRVCHARLGRVWGDGWAPACRDDTAVGLPVGGAQAARGPLAGSAARTLAPARRCSPAANGVRALLVDPGPPHQGRRSPDDVLGPDHAHGLHRPRPCPGPRPPSHLDRGPAPLPGRLVMRASAPAVST